VLALAVIALAGLSYANYLLFHVIVEIIAVVVAVSLYQFAIVTRRFVSHDVFWVLGVGYLFVGVLDLAHILAFPGMSVLAGASVDRGAQAWLCARVLEASLLFVAPLFATRLVPRVAAIGLLATYTLVCLAGVFWLDLFPVCYSAETGLTTFKILAEYAIMAACLGAILTLGRRSELLSPAVARGLQLALGLTLLSEASFTLYVDPYGVFNAAGHLLKVLSFLAVYVALVNTGFRRPAELLFRDQLRSQALLARAHEALEQRVEERTEQLRHEVEERSRAQEQLRVSEELHRVTLSHLSDAIFLADEAGAIHFVAPSAREFLARLLGAEPEAALLRLVLARPEGEAVRSGALLEHRGLELSVPDAQERPHTLQVDLRRVAVGAAHLLVTCRDVTAARRAELELFRRESEWSTAMDLIEDGLCLIDGDGRILRTNRVFQSIVSCTAGELLGRSLCEVVHAESQSCPVCALHSPLRDGRVHWPAEDPANPTGRPILVSQRVVRGPSGSLDCALVGLRDLLGLAELHAHQEQARLVVNTVPSGVLGLDTRGQIMLANRAFEQLVGVERGGVLARDVRELLAPSSVLDPWTALSEKIRAEGDPEPVAVSLRVASGATVPVQINWDYRRALSGEVIGFVAVVTDLSERMEAEARARDGARLEALGTLAGGIAHDFNNLLTPMLVYAELLRAETQEDSDQRELLTEILAGARRARDLTAQILAFGKHAPAELHAQRLQPVIEEACRFLRATLPSSAELRVSVAEACGAVMADTSELHRVIVNLCTNAAHALAQRRGVIEVHLLQATLSDVPEHSRGTLPNGPLVCLRVADDGVGMSAEVQRRIFEPYFTTRGKHEGTGLGLAVVHGVVTSCGGVIDVRSAVGEGTTFNLFFPEVAPGGVREVLTPTPPSEARMEHILVVDDEPAIAAMLKRVLDGAGYRATAFTSSSAALAHLLVDPAAFDLVITDQTMPGLTGLELAKRMLANRPDLPIMLCTGYSEHVDEELALAHGLRSFHTKPLEMEELLRAVRWALDAGAG